MKKIIVLALAIYCSIEHLQAQGFGINTTGASPNASAGLDVDFTNKGVLIPRVALSSLTDAVTIASPATSLLVYSKGGAITDGYYYNSGTSASPVWTSFITSANNSNGCFINWQLFTANGTFTVPAGITKIKVFVYGGGAGGGDGSSSGGMGGGAGGYAEGVYTVVPLNSYTVTVGNGGGAGSNGSSSSFGVLISASGGLAGIFESSCGVSGIGSNGYLNTSLGNGGTGGSSVNPASNGTGGGGTGGYFYAGGYGGGGGGGGFGGGNGGRSINGPSGAGSNALANTGAGGGGGGGGWSGSGGSAGGSGAAGKVIVFW